MRQRPLLTGRLPTVIFIAMVGSFLFSRRIRMHRIALLLIALACFAAPAPAAEVTVVTVETSAQEDADRMAASGRMGHFGRRRGGY